MIFSSIVFIFLFLPVTLVLYYLAGKHFRNTLLLLASLGFYAWGEQFYVLVMLASIGLNYMFGIVLNRVNGLRVKKNILVGGIIANLGILFFFKYANFVLDNLNAFLAVVDVAPIDVPSTHLPIGISFFTFQALSYIIDVYKKTTSVQHNILSLGLYIASFPQLIAGPIVRYHDVALQIAKRTHSLELFSSGIERFVFGLSKKVLIANPMGSMADTIFALDSIHMSTGTAWLGISCYTLQIYYDFSGYSDMAIGLGRMFGFKFLENFNYPYMSKSIREFWRRWHISLSNWFRDYLYIPLGGNRHGSGRTAVNLLIVFLLCGLWHGASWNFILWGLVYGVFLIAERGRFGRLMKGMPYFIQHFYAILVVMNAWVLFRIETIKGIGKYMAAMYGNAGATSMHPIIAIKLDQLFVASLATGIVLSFPVYPMFQEKIKKIQDKSTVAGIFVSIAKLSLLGGLILLSVGQLAVGSYNPFIYFRF